MIACSRSLALGSSSVVRGMLRTKRVQPHSSVSWGLGRPSPRLFFPRGDDDDNSAENLYEHRRLASLPTAMSCRRSHFCRVQQKWHSTSSSGKDSSSESSSSTIRDRAGAIRDTARHRAEEIRESTRHRAQEIRDSARGHMREFRQHPRQSAVKGAKSFGQMIQLYGPVFVGTYMTVYFSTLGIFFVGVESGVLDPAVLFSWLGHGGADEGAMSTLKLVVDFMNQHAITKPYAHLVEKNPSIANLAVAWIAVKFTEPVRFAVTLGITPRVARYLGWTVPADQAEEKTGNEPEEGEDTSSEKGSDGVEATTKSRKEQATTKPN